MRQHTELRKIEKGYCKKCGRKIFNKSRSALYCIGCSVEQKNKWLNDYNKETYKIKNVLPHFKDSPVIFIAGIKKNEDNKNK